MKRKIILILSSALLLFAVMAQPNDGQAASKLEQINQQIKELQKEIDRQAKLRKESEKNAQALSRQMKATKEEIAALNRQIEEVGQKMMQTRKEREAQEEVVRQTQLEKQAAIEKEKTTSESLDARVRLMYTNGTVSYLDVLLSATSFSDFISRFDTFQIISSQTRELLDEQIRIRQLVEEKEAQEQLELMRLELLEQQEAAEMEELERKEKAKEQMYAQLQEEYHEHEEISEEAERTLMELARKMEKLEQERLKEQGKNKVYYTGGKMAVPLKDSYTVSSQYGYRIHPITGKKKLHTGVDMAAKQGTPIYAAESGVVIVAQWWSGYGNTVIIDHGGGVWTLYGHIKNNGILVKKGDTVKRGQKIALVGSTGNSTGPHLHFEVRKNSEPVDPNPYLK
jgi:murein DD-endopeptidase MepM/ murein hydrolase activator NlpD